MYFFRKWFRPVPWLACGLLAALAFFLKFCVPGYSFSALVCCGIIAVILFYEVTRILLPRYPKVLKPLRRIFTACLVIGLLVFSITEGCIIGASFGNPEKHCDYFVVLGGWPLHIPVGPDLWCGKLSQKPPRCDCRGLRRTG